MRLTEDGQTAARDALREIELTQERSRAYSFYRASAPIVMIWGVVWLVCNIVSHVDDGWGSMAWTVGILVGVIASIFFGWRQRDRRPSLTGRETPGWRMIVLGIVFACVLIAGISGIAMIGGLNQLQLNAIISLIVAISYITAGLQSGWRMSALGLVVGAAAIIGWVALRDIYELWMGLFAGGALLLGGYWMSRS
ncbi:hypothetical protein [Aquisalinus flavus]|nr:hypothetical protein [Aquisalinus flavus]MBD0426767.1 hypothetical protein [Aquisalinus flavus]UNE46622.1 hypothetical protein FF099_00380 [Aquisalinus flavus]